MAKSRPRFGQRPAIFLVRREKRVESDLSQRDDHTDGFEQFDLLDEIRPAALEFNPRRFIIRRRAPNRGGNVTIREFQSVISPNRVRLIGESGGVKGSVEPVAAAIPGKYSAGPISPVRRRRQADYQQTRLGVAKAGEWLRPIGFTQVPLRRIARHLLAPAHQPRAFATNRYCSVKLLDLVHGLLNVLLAQRRGQGPCGPYRRHLFPVYANSTLVYAYSNFLKWHPDSVCPAEKFFSPGIPDWNVPPAQAVEVEKKRIWTMNCLCHRLNCNKQLFELTQRERKTCVPIVTASIPFFCAH
jgi:hypothetical protein